MGARFRSVRAKIGIPERGNQSNQSVVDMSTTLDAKQHSIFRCQLKINGELVVWTGERMSFDALQQRNVSSTSTVRRELVPALPASLIVFDLLAVDGVDIRPMRWSTRRRRLEDLAETWRPYPD